MNIQRIEEASLNAWAAQEQLLYDGWMLRFNQGYTKRANSVNPLYRSALPLDDKIAFCEARFHERHLPPVWRITPFADCAEVDSVLAERGYDRVQPSRVLARTTAASENHAACVELPWMRWLDEYSRLQGSSAEDRMRHALILRRMSGTRIFAAWIENDEPVACGLGVVEGELLGIFDIVVDPLRRRRGLGRALTQSLLARGRGLGATQAYLQVIDANAPARTLYDGLGFVDAYSYTYRVRR